MHLRSSDHQDHHAGIRAGRTRANDCKYSSTTSPHFRDSRKKPEKKRQHIYCGMSGRRDVVILRIICIAGKLSQLIHQTLEYLRVWYGSPYALPITTERIFHGIFATSLFCPCIIPKWRSYSHPRPTTKILEVLEFRSSKIENHHLLRINFLSTF